ncbi:MULTISPECIES: hypothetical protein [unclassified Curtobacterium]|uniref:hypothetical protein n=1 Tax=unclassified Curtobacterium TaxID=257496 RepID=UPI00226B4D03|nr:MULTISPECIES: hypothetical protein [unclassified Curtobacterium]
MHTFTRGIVSVALLSTAALALAGCSPTTSADPTVSAGPSESSSAATTTTPSASPIAFGTAPSRAGIPACDALLPADLVQALVPGAKPVDTLVDTPDIAGAWAFAATAGGTDCESANSVSAIDEVLPTTKDDPAYQGVRLTVLPDAAADFVDAQTSATSPEVAATTVRCDASDSARVYCGGAVRAGTAWVDIRSVRLQDTVDATPEVSEPAFKSLLAATAAAVEGSALGSATTEHGAPDGSYTTCDATNVNAVASKDLADPDTRGGDASAGLQQYAMNRLGGSSCVFEAQGAGEQPYAITGAVYSVVPGGGWVVERRLDAGTIDRADRVELDGLPAGAAAWRSCTDLACSVDVVDDGDWTHFVLYERVADEPSDGVVRWAEASLAG